MEHVSNFELYGNDGYTKDKPFRFLEKFNFLLLISLFFEIIYLICINNFLNKKTNQFNELNYRRFELNSKNQKLSNELYQAIEKNNSFNEEIKEKNDKIKIIQDYLYEYTNLSKKLLNSEFSANELLIKKKDKNNEKRKKINELKTIKDKAKEELHETFDSAIVDTELELKIIINLIDSPNMMEIRDKLKLCYRSHGDNLNLTIAYGECGLNNNNSFLMLFQSDIYKRYGAFISNNNKSYPFIFIIYPNGIVYETKIENLNMQRKQSLMYIINLIKKHRYDNHETSLDSNCKIIDFEIFNI